MKVICCKADQFEECKSCEHADPHEPMETRDTDRCTKWGECYCDEDDGLMVVRVRCTKVKNSTTGNGYHPMMYVFNR